MSKIGKPKLNQRKIISKINGVNWHADWSGPFPLVEVSTSHRIYFNGLRRVFGWFFSSFFVDYQKGIASVRLPENEYRALGKYLGKKLENVSYAKLWAKEFKQVADEITAAISMPPERFLKKLKSFNRLYETYGAYNVATKVVFDVMYGSLSRKTAKTLAEAREYSESFYKNNSAMFANVAKLISKQTGYAKENILMMNRDELLRFVKTREIPAEDLLSSRYERSSVYFTKRKIYFLSAEETNKIEKTWIRDAKWQELKGKSAFVGKVKGRCWVILDYHQAIIKKDEILVTGMTDPNYLFLMKKAAAIITDGGGMLSHAAIAARELKKPCIIGTKIATKVLQDGDMVEVDANKGIVRRIS